MKRIFGIQITILLALILAFISVPAQALSLEVSENGIVTADADGDDLLYLASYDPADGRYRGLLSNETKIIGNAAIKAMQTDESFVPQSESKSALVITAPGSCVGGEYDILTVTGSAADGTVSLSHITLRNSAKIHAGGVYCQLMTRKLDKW